MRNTTISILNAVAAMMLAATISGCDLLCSDNCKINETSRKVLLLYSAGCNSLRNYLQEDIEDLKDGWLPGKGCGDNILLVYTHSSLSYGHYNKPSTPYLIRLYKNKDGKAVVDTIKTYEPGTISASASQLNEVLTYVKDNFTSGSYGMIFSSHATGYLPAGFYSDPEGYVFQRSMMKRARAAGAPISVPYIEPEYDPSLPMVKSIGQDVSGTGSSLESYEIDLPEFAEAIPMKLDYILFDACLMGGIEVAYELRDKCGLLGFSQAEVLADGLPYKTLTRHLLQNGDPDLRAICKEYFTQYDIQSGVYKSATVSLIDCGKLEPLADLCTELFASYREGMKHITPSSVQGFYRDEKHWFYDLESIIKEAGASEADITSLHTALDQCVLYKAHTPEFMSEFQINTFSGFSMYLPCDGNTELDKFYRTLKWNQDTGLVP